MSVPPKNPGTGLFFCDLTPSGYRIVSYTCPRWGSGTGLLPRHPKNAKNRRKIVQNRQNTVWLCSTWLLHDNITSISAYTRFLVLSALARINMPLPTCSWAQSLPSSWAAVWTLGQFCFNDESWIPSEGDMRTISPKVFRTEVDMKRNAEAGSSANYAAPRDTEHTYSEIERMQNTAWIGVFNISKTGHYFFDLACLISILSTSRAKKR